MLQADNHEDARVFIDESVVGCILDKGGAKEHNVVKLPPEGATVGLEDTVSSLNSLAQRLGH